jgi:hypothetical protein
VSDSAAVWATVLWAIGQVAIVAVAAWIESKLGG